MTEHHEKYVYVVTFGEYSDMHVDSVFTTREAAEEYAEKVSKESPNVIPIVIDNPGGIPHGITHFRVEMLSDGKAYTGFGTPHHKHRIGIPLSEIMPSYYKLADGSIQSSIVIDILAKDEQHAAKIANEKRSQLIANGTWKVGDDAKAYYEKLHGKR